MSIAGYKGSEISGGKALMCSIMPSVTVKSLQLKENSHDITTRNDAEAMKCL